MRRPTLGTIPTLGMILALCPLAALAWEPLSGADLENALIARTLRFDDATYGFRAGGVATRDDGDWTEGQWRVDGAQLCISWPEERAVCTTVERDTLDLRLTAPDGTARVGRYVDL